MMIPSWYAAQTLYCKTIFLFLFAISVYFAMIGFAIFQPMWYFHVMISRPSKLISCIIRCKFDWCDSIDCIKHICLILALQSVAHLNVSSRSFQCHSLLWISELSNFHFCITKPYIFVWVRCCVVVAISNGKFHDKFLTHTVKAIHNNCNVAIFNWLKKCPPP